MGQPLVTGQKIDIEAFIARWTAREGGAERANYALFLTELCDLIGVERPDPSGSETERNDYVFERAVRFRHDNGTSTTGRIDLYKRGSFVLEAKQSKKRVAGGDIYEQMSFFLPETPKRRSSSRRADAGGASAWDLLMRSAKKQAADYARALDEWPPFLIVVDVGHVIELYSDFQRQGKDYVQFPNRNEYRIRMEDLRRPEIRERLAKVWTDPMSLDPARHAAEVTQGIAVLLAKMTQSIERRAPSDDPQMKAEWAYKVSKFLMRCIFAMFADSMELLPRGGLIKLIEDYKGNAKHFHIVADQFFNEMDRGTPFSPHLKTKIRKFNGGLFHDAVTIEINEDELEFLRQAAMRDWHNVEPAIFGTLLEQALSPSERSRLGAHYTPRAYVERLVVPTIIEPLNADWDIVQSQAIGRALANDYAEARAIVKKFHDRLCDTRVLDPACGTGNFLYVAMELMKRLEGEVLEFLRELGEPNDPLRTIDPHQFLGIEKNPRAVPIAELVLWIGYIQWWFRTRQRQVMQDPVLRDFGAIREGDAVLSWRKQEFLKDRDGRPVTRQDPSATKLHPVTGEAIPDPDARLPVYSYVGLSVPKWPEAEFIIGNPPFIGGKDLRRELGDGYTEALWASRGKKSDSIDFVMYWWDMAADILRRDGSKLRRFGFITTNSITQKFSRRVIQKHLEGRPPLSLVFAVPDHPWMKQSGKAAVRIAMTVAERGETEGMLAEVEAESGLETDAPQVVLAIRQGRINSDLTTGTDVKDVASLAANDGLCSPGVKLHGDGFIVTPQEAASLGLGKIVGLERHIRQYRNGRDLAARPRGVMVIDLFGLDEADVRRLYPSIYQHLLSHVKPERDLNNRQSYRDNWWIFGEARKDLRPALAGLNRFIATVETSKHRFFEFLDISILPDNMIVAIASSNAFDLGVLSSKQHVLWALSGGTLEDRPRYTKSECFDPFPFPDASDAQRAAIAALAEELDAFRKNVIAQHDFLTMTKLYNVRERLKEIEAGKGAPLDESERAIHEAGCVGVIHELHRRIDAAVAGAYGWPADLSDEEILARLVALNRERAAEEKQGLVRWLRPDYQIPRSRLARDKGARPAQIDADLAMPAQEAPPLPKDDEELIAVLRRTLGSFGRPADARAVAAKFANASRATQRIEKGLRILAAAGSARRAETGWFIPAERR